MNKSLDAPSKSIPTYYFYLMTGSQMSEGSSVKQTTKQLSNEHLQLQQTQEEESLERGFPIDDFDSIEDIEDIDGEYNDNNVHHQYLVIHTFFLDSISVHTGIIKGPDSWWIAKSVTISRVVNQSKVNPQRVVD